MNTEFAANIELVSDYILIRRPALPRFWDPVSRPYVALIVEDPISEKMIRYYLSFGNGMNKEGRELLDVVDLDVLVNDLQHGALLEVRFSATQANLYQLEILRGMPCWRWIGKYRGIQDFNYPSTIDWESLINESRVVMPHGIVG
ncbi:MAG: hypothetical protein ACTSQZ_03245 [Candidatus Thorarchaeota archaeon]